MIDPRPNRVTGERGTTLVELLVVILLLGIIGAVTTTSIVQSFRTQLAATNVAETLDGTRIATQRVRDFVRGADEVCASSEAASLVLWSDDDGDGAVTNAEIDIFELVPDAVTGDDVFQRRVPIVGAEQVQLIRDDIINAAVFGYDTPPEDQPAALECTDGETVTDGPARTRVVDVEFTVQDPDPSAPAGSGLTTATSVRLRNAGLDGTAGNQSPSAAFTFSCTPGLSCDFDASGSVDADGTIDTYEWTFDDGTTDTGETVIHPFAGTGPYDVQLRVTDDEGAFGTDTQEVTPIATGGNQPPEADFTVSCNERDCSFDAEPSVDPDGTIVSYAWNFGDSTTGTGETTSRLYNTPGIYTVTLTVTDDDGGTDSEAKGITASATTVRIDSISAFGNPGGGSKYDAEVTVRVTSTSAGAAVSGIVVSATLSGAASGTVSCTTANDGRCSFTTQGNSPLKNLDGADLILDISQLVDSRNPAVYSYDSDQNLANTVTVGRGETKQGTL